MQKSELNAINFNNIGTFLEAVDLTNKESVTHVMGANHFICDYLSTGNSKLLSKNARKIMKEINFDELMIDIQATLMLHDLIPELVNQRSAVVKVYDSSYWEILYKGIVYRPDDYNKFIDGYIENLDLIINNNLCFANQIIYTFLYDTLIYVKELFNDCELDREKLYEYHKAMIIPRELLAKKNNIEKSKIKSLYRRNK